MEAMALTTAQHKMMEDGEAEYNALPDDKKKVIERAMKDFGKEAAFYLVNHLHQATIKNRRKGDLLKPGASYTLLIDGLNLGASADDVAALLHEIDNSIDPVEISAVTTIQPPRQAADFKGIANTISARIMDLPVTSRISEFAAGTIDVSDLSAQAQSLIIRAEHDMFARTVVHETATFVLLRDVCCALGVPPLVFESIIHDAIHVALPDALSTAVIAVRAEEHTFADRSDGKRTRKVPVSAGYDKTRTLVYTTDQKTRDHLVSTNSLLDLKIGSRRFGITCQVLLQKLRPKDEHVSRNEQVLSRRGARILQDVRENYPPTVMVKRLTFEPKVEFVPNGLPLLHKLSPPGQEQEACSAMGGLACGIYEAIIPRNEQNQINYHGEWHIFVLESGNTTFAEQLKTKLIGKSAVRPGASKIFNAFTTTAVTITNIATAAPQAQHTGTPQISVDEFSQKLTRLLLDQPRYLYSETLDGKPLITNEKDGELTPYDSLGAIGPSGHAGSPDIRTVLLENHVPESIFYETLSIQAELENLLMINGTIGDRPVWYICHPLRKPALPSVLDSDVAMAEDKPNQDDLANTEMKQD